MHATSVPPLYSTSVVVKVSLCLLAVGCVKVPPFDQRDGGGSGSDAQGDGGMTPPLVDVQMIGNGARARMHDYELVFSNLAAKFPYQLNLDPYGAQPQLIMGGSEQCADEAGMGIALYPSLRINGAPPVGGGSVGTPTIAIPLQGPYVGQLRLGWSASFPCTTPGTGALTGHTTFSFFPNGRFTRYDLIDNPSPRDSASCPACQGSPGTFFLTSYTTLVVDGNAFISEGTSSDFDSYGEERGAGTSACITERGGYSIAFAWVNSQTRARTAAVSPARTIAFIKDIEPATPTLPQTEWRTTTQMGVSKETCGVLEPRVAEFEVDYQLDINGAALGSALGDGIFGGDPREAGGQPVDFPVTLQPGSIGPGRIAAGFAVWLYHAPIPQPLTLVHSRGPADGTWYYEQRVGQNSVVYWFDISLEAGETITISGP
jgi:hypothetical protein